MPTKNRVEGAIFGRVKGGFTVDLGGAVAFLPGSQVDVRPVRDAGPLMGLKQPFQILKMDRRRGNIVVSRRAILEESRAEQRAEVIGNLARRRCGGRRGQEHHRIRRLCGSGRCRRPAARHRHGLAPRQPPLRDPVDRRDRQGAGHQDQQGDPPHQPGHEAADGRSLGSSRRKYPLESVHTGRVTNITDYGAFVELEPVSRAWSTSRKCPGPRRTSIPARSCRPPGGGGHGARDRHRQAARLAGPQADHAQPLGGLCRETHPEGTEVEGEVKNITEFGLFVGLPGDIDGMVHLSDICWDERGEDAIQDYRKGDMVKAVVTEVDTEKERISLSIKAVGGDTFADRDRWP